MKPIDNIKDLLGDDVKKSVQPAARLKIAASTFSIYAFEALKRELESVESFEFIFTSPSFVPDEVTDAAKKERRDFHIPKSGTERSFYGTEFEVQLKNKLTQRAIAHECADWMRRKAKFRSNSGVAPLQQFAAVQAGASATVPNAVYMPLHGFTAVDLGYQRGNAVSNIVNKFDEPANTGVFLSLFDQIWADPDKLKDVTSLVCGKRSANPPCADDVGVLRALYAKAASVGADAAVSPGAADLQLCGSSDARSRCLSGSSRSNTSFR